MLAAPLSRRRRLAFSLMTTLVLAGGIELGCRLIERIDNAAARRRNPYVEPVNPVPAFEILEVSGRKWVRRTGNHPLMRPHDPFPLERPPGGLRIFVLGGSAAAGWPYQMGETNLTALLERKLRLLFPGRPIEVMSLAAGTYASHRVKLLLEEALRYQPDALFLYNGNNEFLEGLVYRPLRPPSPWDRSAALRLAYRVALTLATPLPRFDVKNYDLEAQTSNELSYAFLRASRYREDPRQFEALLGHYRFNIEEMVTAAQEAKVPLFLLTCPVDLKDWTPNVSRHRKGLAAAELRRWTEQFREGYLALERQDFDAAIGPLERAIAVDDEYAEAHFLLAEALRKSGRNVDAKREYVAALRRDAFPFRELPEFQEILRDVATRRGAPLVDIIGPLEAIAGDGIPGSDVLIDYVHLSERSQEIVAQVMLRALHAKGLLPGVTQAAVEGARIAIERKFDPVMDSYAADVLYNSAMIMHQYRRVDRLYATLIDTLERAAREDPAHAREYRRRIGIFHRVQGIVTPYRDLLIAQKLGLLEDLYTPEQVAAIYKLYRGVIYMSKADRLSQEEFLRLTPDRPFAAEGEAPR